MGGTSDRENDEHRVPIMESFDYLIKILSPFNKGTFD